MCAWLCTYVCFALQLGWSTGNKLHFVNDLCSSFVFWVPESALTFRSQKNHKVKKCIHADVFYTLHLGPAKVKRLTNANYICSNQVELLFAYSLHLIDMILSPLWVTGLESSGASNCRIMFHSEVLRRITSKMLTNKVTILEVPQSWDFQLFLSKANVYFWNLWLSQ